MSLKIIFFKIGYFLILIFFINNFFLPKTSAAMFCEAINFKDPNKKEKIKNFWLKEIEIEKKNWRQVSADFHIFIDLKFTEKIKTLTKNNKKDENEKSNNKKSKCNLVKNNPVNIAFDNFAQEINNDAQMFQCALFYTWKNAKIEIGDSFESHKIMQKQNMEKKAIAQEIQITSKSIQTALKAISEMQIAYIIHKRLECLTEKLTSLRDNLNKFIKEAVKIPSRYINSSFY